MTEQTRAGSGRYCCLPVLMAPSGSWPGDKGITGQLSAAPPPPRCVWLQPSGRWSDDQGAPGVGPTCRSHGLPDGGSGVRAPGPWTRGPGALARSTALAPVAASEPRPCLSPAGATVFCLQGVHPPQPVRGGRGQGPFLSVPCEHGVNADCFSRLLAGHTLVLPGPGRASVEAPKTRDPSPGHAG